MEFHNSDAFDTYADHHNASNDYEQFFSNEEGDNTEHQVVLTDLQYQPTQIPDDNYYEPEPIFNQELPVIIDSTCQFREDKSFETARNFQEELSYNSAHMPVLHVPSTSIHVPTTSVHVPVTAHVPTTVHVPVTAHVPSTSVHVPTTSIHVPATTHLPATHVPTTMYVNSAPTVAPFCPPYMQPYYYTMPPIEKSLESFTKRGFELMEIHKRLDRSCVEYRIQWENAAALFRQHKVEISQLKRMSAQEIMDFLRNCGLMEYGTLRRISEAIVLASSDQSVLVPQLPPPVTPPTVPNSLDQYLNKDIQILSKHGSRQKLVTQALNCGARLDISFSGVSFTQQKGEFCIIATIFFAFFNIYRLINNFAPILHDSIMELFRNSKSSWAKVNMTDGQFLIKKKEEAIPHETDEGSATVFQILSQFQLDKERTKILQEKIDKFLDDEKLKKNKQPKSKGGSPGTHLVTTPIAVKESNPVTEFANYPSNRPSKRQLDQPPTQTPTKRQHCVPPPCAPPASYVNRISGVPPSPQPFFSSQQVLFGIKKNL